jgi:eukaryotic-like serine/threonine-protein kinase
VSDSDADTLPAESDAAAEERDFGPGAIVGRYIVLGRLGEGGMGVVLLAYDPQLGRRIALKVLRRGAERASLLHEAQSIAQLAHANVIAVYDLGEVGS